MTSPKDLRNALLGVGLAGANSGTPAGDSSMSAPAPRVAAGAVGAVSRSLSRFDQQLREAQKLATEGERVVELPTDSIDPSFARDRMEADQAAHAALVDSLKAHGQQVPILVRPSPEAAGRYQIAYGHRRYHACVELGIMVKAIIRPLDDAALLIAQGQENSARKDLSFIERALFAATLEDRGFTREVTISALSTDKTEVSKLLAVVRAIPRDILDAIGPAPKAGRTRWMGLAEMLRAARVAPRVRTTMRHDDFLRLSSDERFNRVFKDAAAKPKGATRGQDWIAPTGSRPIKIEHKPQATVLTIREPVAPDFARFLIDQLPELFAFYQAQKDA